MEPSPGSADVEMRYYLRDGSVFLGTQYLIKGVAGALLRKLVREHLDHGRTEFSLRELRLAGRELRLPVVQDNLSVRLLLLQRRLAERGSAVQIHRIGRGRFRIDVARPLLLQEMPEATDDAPVAPAAAQDLRMRFAGTASPPRVAA